VVIDLDPAHYNADQVRLIGWVASMSNLQNLILHTSLKMPAKGNSWSTVPPGLRIVPEIKHLSMFRGIELTYDGVIAYEPIFRTEIAARNALFGRPALISRPKPLTFEELLYEPETAEVERRSLKECMSLPKYADTMTAYNGLATVDEVQALIEQEVEYHL
jgi:hypothetical protein